MEQSEWEQKNTFEKIDMAIERFLIYRIYLAW